MTFSWPVDDGRQPAVLVVEDDANLRLSIRLVLDAAGWAVSEAATGAEAVSLAEAELPDVIVLDLGLPDGDGREFLSRLKSIAATAWIPVVVLSGQKDASIVSALLRGGAQDYVVKPFTRDEFGARLIAARRVAVEHRQLHRSEARYRGLVACLPDTLVSVFDPELRLRWTDESTSDRWDVAGYRGARVLGTHLESLMRADEFALVGSHYAAAASGQTVAFDYVSPRSGRDLLVDLVPVFADGGSVAEVVTISRDVTATRAVERARLVAEARYRVAFDAGPVGMAQLDLAGCFVEVNQKLCELLGYVAADLKGARVVDFVELKDASELAEALVSVTRAVTYAALTEARLVHADGRIVWAAVSISSVTDDQGSVTHFLSHFVDATDRKRLEQRLEHLADHDELTGLLNRRGFDAELGRHTAMIARYGVSGALLILDVDHFKRINDAFGHSAGDDVIASVGHLLRETVRETDVVARPGGDEFAIILPHANRDEARIVAEKILGAVHAHITALTGASRRITVSIGVALFDDLALTGERVLENADLAMYAAKNGGRDRYAMYSDATPQLAQMSPTCTGAATVSAIPTSTPTGSTRT